MLALQQYNANISNHASIAAVYCYQLQPCEQCSSILLTVTTMRAVQQYTANSSNHASSAAVYCLQ